MKFEGWIYNYIYINQMYVIIRPSSNFIGMDE